MEALNETVNHVKTDLMPDYNFDEFRQDPYDQNETESKAINL
jgi:hypothetical protein